MKVSTAAYFREFKAKVEGYRVLVRRYAQGGGVSRQIWRPMRPGLYGEVSTLTEELDGDEQQRSLMGALTSMSW